MSRDLRLSIILGAVDKASNVLKKITGSNKGLAAQLKNTRDQKKALDAQMGDLKNFRTLNAQIRINERAIKQKNQAIDASKQALDELRSKHQNTKASLASAKSAYDKLSNALLDGKGNTAQFSSELEKARIRLLSAQQGFERSSSAIKKQREALRINEGALKSLANTNSQLSQRLTPLNQRLRDNGINLDRAGQSARQLRTQQSSLNAELDKQKESLARVNKQLERRKKIDGALSGMRNKGAAVAAVGAGGAYLGQRAARGLMSALTPGIDYQTQMSELQAVTRLNKDDPVFAQLKAQARHLGGTTAFSANDAGAGQTFLARAGFTPQAILASMQDVLDLALGQKLDLARTADIASNISSAFKIDPEAQGSMKRVADVLATVSSSANVQLEMLGDTMKYLGQAEGLNVTLEQSAVLAGLLGNIGIQGSQAGTTLRAMLNRLSAPAKSGKKAMEEIGLTVADAAGNMRPITDILDDIFDKTKSLGNVKRAELLKHIFGDEAGSGMSELVNQQGAGHVRKMLAALEKSAGESSRAARVMEDNIGGDLLNLESAREEFMITLTEINSGPLRETIQGINDIIFKITEWTKANPELSGTLFKWAAIILGVITVLGVLGFLLGSAISGFAMFGKALMTLAPAIKLIGFLISWMGRLLLLNPIGLTITALALAAALIYTHWEPIKAFFQNLWEGITGFFSKGIGHITSSLINWSPLGLLYNLFTTALENLGISVPEKFKSLGGLIVDGLLSGLKTSAFKVYDYLGNMGSNAIDTVKEKLGIRSPSRVFMSLGNDTVNGFNLGIAQSQSTSLKQLAAWGAEISGFSPSSGLSPIVLSGAPVVTTPPRQIPMERKADSVQINIYSTPQQSAVDIGREVERILTERDRQQASRHRSSYRDHF